MTKWELIRTGRIFRCAEEICAHICCPVDGASIDVELRPSLVGYDVILLALHKADPDLANARLAAYSAGPYPPDCPLCWIRAGLKHTLRIADARPHVHRLYCEQCTFAEFVPCSDAAPAAFMTI